MFKNYFNIALRNLFRQKAHSIINITGLAIGITVCLLIFIWIQYQFSYDKFHTNIDNIYWQHIWSSYEGSRSSSYGTPPAVAPALKEEYPEVVRAARYLPTEGLLGYNDIQFREKIRMVDPDFLKIFTFPFVEGNPSTALNDPHSILLTEKAARKYFEDEDPLGKTIRLNNQIDLRVTGILQDLPENSTFGFKILTPIELARETHGETFIDTWYNCCFYGFVQLQDGVDYTKFNRR